MPKLYRVILPVSDIDKAAVFYARLLGLPGQRVTSGRHYFDCEGVILACFDTRADGDDFDAKPNPGHVYFAVSDLEAAYELARKVRAVWIWILPSSLDLGANEVFMRKTRSAIRFASWTREPCSQAHPSRWQNCGDC